MDKTQLTNMTTRQKAIAGVIVLVVLVILWQIIGLFRGGSTTSTTAPNKTNGTVTPGARNSASSSQPLTPQPAQLSPPRMSDQQQAELVRLQRETQEKYVLALNELQMLKLSQQIAETNKDIAAAKLATVTAEKSIVDLLTKPAPPVETPASFTQGGAIPVPAQPGAEPPAMTAVTTTTTTQSTTANYIVISVSQLLSRWSAVLGYQGKLYSVLVGDVLPPDQSTVIAIDKYSVSLEKDGIVRKVSLVPII